MARLFRTTKVRRKTVRMAVGATSLGVAAAMMLAVASSGTAFADVVLPGGSGTYQVGASSAGLYLALAGTQLTGGTSAVSGTYDSNKGETAAASGQGFLLSTQLTGTGPSVSEDNTSGSCVGKAVAPYTGGAAKGCTFSGTEGTDGDTAGTGSNGSTGGSTEVDAPPGYPTVPLPPTVPDDCAQGGGSVQSGVGLSLGLGCGYATATVDPAGTKTGGPQAFGAGDIASVTVSLGGILSQIYSGGASSLCAGLANAPVLGTACYNILNGTPLGTATGIVNPSVQVNVGNAYSQIISTTHRVMAIANSSSVDVSLFPGIDSGLEPLLRVQIPSAEAVSCESDNNTCTPPSTSDACVAPASAGGWTNWYDASIIRITGTLIDALSTASMGSFPNPLEILNCSQLASANSGLGQAESAGLNALLNIQLASATTNGSGVSGSGALIQLLPGQVSGQPVLNVNGAGITTTNSGTATAGTAVTPASSPAGSPPQVNQAVPTVAAAVSPTAVHTGEWWAGSMPLLAMLAALGGGLLAWPRLRRFPMVAHIVSRSSH